MPVEYIRRTREHFERLGFPPYKWTENKDCPYWTPLAKPLSECRVALLSTGGIYIKDKQEPFNPERDDLTFRQIPTDIDPRELAISHGNYDHSDAERDINCVFPIERLRELDEEGYIGEFVSPSYTVMGRIFRRTALQQEMTPQLLQWLKDAKVDVLVMVPA